MSRPKSLRDDHADATRAAVLAASRKAFASAGYAATSIDDVAAAARVTKGAVYHHFHDKRDLFRAVYVELAQDIDARIRAASGTGHPLVRVQAAIDAFLACGRVPELRRVVFQDGMAVLAGECREIDARYFLDLLVTLLAALREANLLVAVDEPTIARLILAALIEAAQLLGRSEDVAATEASLRAALGTLLAGLLRR